MLTAESQRINLNNSIASFYKDRRNIGRSSRTLDFYTDKLGIFTRYFSERGVEDVTTITPEMLQDFFLWYRSDHTPGGTHAVFRVTKAYLRYVESFYEPEGWRNPIRKVKVEAAPDDPLDPVAIDTVQAMVDHCDKSLPMGARDKVVLAMLLDTGARASEFLALNVGDVNLLTGEVKILHGKGRRTREVFINQNVRRLLRAYLRKRGNPGPNEPLWMTREGNRLQYRSLLTIVEHRAADAKVSPPELHSFRRAFAINMLRSGVDVFTLGRLMGIRQLQVLRRYLQLVTDDLEQAHRRASPANKLKL